MRSRIECWTVVVATVKRSESPCMKVVAMVLRQGACLILLDLISEYDSLSKGWGKSLGRSILGFRGSALDNGPIRINLCALDDFEVMLQVTWPERTSLARNLT